MNHYNAIRLPQHRGSAPWSDLLAPPAPARVLTKNRRADFTIIGAGFAGLSAARRLRQLNPKVQIALLEAGRIAQGAGGRNSGFMIDLPHELTAADYAGDGDDRQLIALNRHAIAFARDGVADYDIDPNFFDAAGKVNGAVSNRAHRHNLSYRAHLHRLGEESDWLDQQDMYDLTGSRHYQSGLYTAGTVLLQPAGYLRGFVAGLTRQNVDIYENSPVLRIIRKGTDWQVITAQGVIDTGCVILANNGHLESFGFEKGRLLHIFLFGSMTAELNRDVLHRLGGQPRWGITPSDPMGTTMRRIDAPLGGNRIIVRTCAVLRSNMQAKAYDVKRAARIQRRKFNQRFPQLAGVGMAHSWAGHLCLSLNGVGVTRALDDGLFAACVQNGLGTTRGTLAGIAAAELASGQSSDVTAYFAAQERPKRLPPRGFATIGANAVLRYQEWRARAE